MRDITSNLDLKRAISPQAARTDNTAIVSQVVDLRSYDACMLAINIGANTDVNATFAVLMELDSKKGNPLNLLSELDEEFSGQINAAEYIPFQGSLDDNSDDDQ